MGGRVEKRGSGKGTEDIYIMKYQRLRRSSLFGQISLGEMPRSSVQRREDRRPLLSAVSEDLEDRSETEEIQKDRRSGHQRGIYLKIPPYLVAAEESPKKFPEDHTTTVTISKKTSQTEFGL